MLQTIEVKKMKKYTPYQSDAYDFPVTEIPVYGRLGALEIESEDSKGIVRTDTNKLISVVSNKYKLVPHAQVISAVESELRKDHDFKRTVYMTHDGARVYSEYLLSSMTQEIGDGDSISAKLIARNSYDGSTIMAINLEGLRLLCLNGLMGFGSLFSFGKKHMGEISVTNNMGQEINSALSTYKDSLIPHWKNLSQKQLSKDKGIDIIKDISLKKVVPEKYEEDVMQQWDTKVNQFNAWLLYNCYTFVLTHLIKKVSYENYINLSKKVSSHFKVRFAA